MRSAVLGLTWYQYFLLDVMAVLALVLGFVSLTGFLICRAVFKKVCSSTSKNKSISEKKKIN
jgi:hypothetical protein